MEFSIALHLPMEAALQALGGPRFIPLVTLQGEIGTSSMKSRDIINKLKIWNHLKNASNSLLKAMIENTSKKVVQMVRTSYIELSTIKEEKINLMVNQWEERRWRSETAELKREETLKIYEAMKEIEKGLYSNSFSLVILFTCKSKKTCFS